MLTKDEIDALMPEPAAPAEVSGYVSAYEPLPATPDYYTAEQVHSVVSAAIAAHTAKVLGDVEPVAWASKTMCIGPAYGKVHYDKLPIQSLNPLYYTHEPLYPAHTVAALKSRADALAARVAELEKDAARYRLLRRGQKWSVVDGIGAVLRAEVLDATIDAALAAKGQA